MSYIEDRGFKFVGNRLVPYSKPEPKRCALYRHFDAAGTLLYVGISVSVLRRLAQHSRGAHWSEKIASITIERFPDVPAAEQAEEAAIKAEKPLYNIRMSEVRNWPEFTPEEEAAEMAKCERYLARSSIARQP